MSNTRNTVTTDRSSSAESARPIIASATEVRDGATKTDEPEKSNCVKYVLIVLGVLFLLAVIAALACIPLYLPKSTETSTVRTTASFSNLATLAVSKRRRRDLDTNLVDIIEEPISSMSIHRDKRATLQGATGTTDTTNLDNAMKDFFTNEGATSVTISWTENPTYTFSMGAVAEFVTTLSSGADTSSTSTTLVDNIKNKYVTDAASGSLSLPTPSGASMTVTTNLSQIVSSFTEEIGGVVITTTTIAVTTADNSTNSTSQGNDNSTSSGVTTLSNTASTDAATTGNSASTQAGATGGATTQAGTTQAGATGGATTQAGTTQAGATQAGTTQAGTTQAVTTA